MSELSETMRAIDAIATKFSSASPATRQHPLTMAVLAVQALADAGFELLEMQDSAEGLVILPCPGVEVEEWAVSGDE